MTDGRAPSQARSAGNDDEEDFAARVREMLARTRTLVHAAERHVEATGGDSRRFGLPARPGTSEPVNMGEYRRQTNAKGWRKLRL